MPARLVLIDERADALEGTLKAVDSDVASCEAYDSIDRLPSVDFCVVATTTPSKVRAVLTALERGCRRFILEKAYASSRDEFDTLLAETSRTGARVYGGLVHRSMKFWQSFAKGLTAAERGTLSLQLNLGALGLVTDGVHLLDLFAFLTGAERLEVEHVSGFSTNIPSPRGKEFWDLGCHATLRAEDSEASMSLVINPNHNAFGALTLVTERSIVVTADLYSHVLQARLVEPDPDRPVYFYGRGWSDWVSRPAGSDFDYLHLYTATFSHELGGDKRAATLLPRLSDGVPAHNALYDLLAGLTPEPHALLP